MNEMRFGRHQHRQPGSFGSCRPTGGVAELLSIMCRYLLET